MIDENFSVLKDLLRFAVVQLLRHVTIDLRRGEEKMKEKRNDFVQRTKSFAVPIELSEENSEEQMNRLIFEAMPLNVLLQGEKKRFVQRIFFRIETVQPGDQQTLFIGSTRFQHR